MADWDVLSEQPAKPESDPWAVTSETRAAKPSFANVRSGFSSTEAPAYSAQRFERQPLESRIASSNRTRALIGLEPIEAPQRGDLGELLNRGLVAIPEHLGSLARLPEGLAAAVERATGLPVTRVPATPLQIPLPGGGTVGSYISELASEPARRAEQVQYGTPSVGAPDLSAALGLAPRETVAADTGRPISPPTLADRAGTVGRFVLEQGARSLPEALATVAAPEAYIAARTQEIAENRAGNLGEAAPGLGQYGAALPAAAIETLLERYTTGRLLPGGGSAAGTALGRVGKEAALQGGLGGLEELAPYLAEQAGTQKPVTAGQALDTFLSGAVAEGALGGTVQGAKEIAARGIPRTMEEVAPPRGEARAEPIEPKAEAPRAPPAEVRAAPPEPTPTAKPRVSLAEVQAEQARRSDEAARKAEVEAAQRAFEQGPGEGVDFASPERAPQAKIDEALALSDVDYLARVNPSKETTNEETSTQLAEELQDRDVPSRATPIKDVQGVTLFADGDYLYAADGERVVGVLGAKPSGNEFAVDPEYRGKGIGTAMMRELLVRDPFALSGGLSPSAEATRLAALRQLREEGPIAEVPHGEPEPAAIAPEATAIAPEQAKSEPPAPKPVGPAVGLNKAAIDARRELEGRDPILKEAAVTNRETVDKAFNEIAGNPNKGEEVVSKLLRGEPASHEDAGVLLVHMSDVRQNRDRAADVLADPKASEDAKAVATREYGEYEGRLNSAEQASRALGRQGGRVLQFMQRMLADDFTLEALERKERARLQRPLDKKEAAGLKVMAEKIATETKKREAAEARLAQVESETAYDALIRDLSQAPKQRPTLDKLRAAADESRKELDRILGRTTTSAGVDPRAFYHAARIGAYHVANGLTRFADWAARMRADLGELAERLPLPDIFKAALVQAKRPIAAGASVSEVVAKIQGAPTGKDVRAVAEAHIREGLRAAPEVFKATAESLGITEQQVRDLFTQITPSQPRTVDEAKAEVARLRKELQQAASGRRREQAEAQREAERPTAEERTVAAIRKRINALQDRIARGDFAKPERVQKQLTAAVEKAKFEETQAKEEFLRHQFEASIKARPPLAKVLGGVGDVFNLARAVMTSLDLSGVLRQGGFITYGHPVRAARSLGPSLKAFASAQAEHTAKSEILARPNAPLYKKYGLELTGIGGGPLSQIEEAYASRWLDRIPTALGGGLVRGSGRSYATFLNRLRADSFDAMAASLSKGSTATPDELKAIARYINVATGRGKIGTSENAGQVLNTVFFAPRLVASRFQLLAGQPLYGGTNRTRALVAQDYARFMVGVGVAISLAAYLKDPEDETPLIELDPRSSDFGKVRYGNTFLDPLAGLAQVTTVFSRLASGETKTAKGVKPLRAHYTLTDLRRALGSKIEPHKLSKEGGLPFGSGDAADVITRFLRTKLAPVPGAIVNTLAGENVVGQPVTPSETAQELVTPMSFNNLADIMEEQGVERGTAITLLGLLGMGVQYREQKQAKGKPSKKEVAAEVEAKSGG